MRKFIVLVSVLLLTTSFTVACSGGDSSSSMGESDSSSSDEGDTSSSSDESGSSSSTDEGSSSSSTDESVEDSTSSQQASEDSRDALIEIIFSEFIDNYDFSICLVDAIQASTGWTYEDLLDDVINNDGNGTDEIEAEVLSCLPYLDDEEIAELTGETDEAEVPNIQISPNQDALGAILAVEEIDFSDSSIIGWVVTYRSISIAGDPIEVTGTIIAPNSVATEPRPVLSIGHSTLGMADMCAPSLNFMGDDVVLTGRDALFEPLLNDGWIVVTSDFEGLGGPGLHPYIIGASEAQGIFDIVRAAQTAPTLGADGPLFVWGHSQGGHAAMHVSQLWQTIAPELDLVGVAASAPPSQFPLLADYLKGGEYQGYLVMVMAALAEVYEELSLETIIAPEYMPLLDELELGCSGYVRETFNGIPFEDLTSVDDVFADPDWFARLLENDVNLLPNETPVLILHAGQDEQIPIVSTSLLLDQICALEGHEHIERHVYEGEFTHSDAPDVHWDDLMDWMYDRIYDRPVDEENECLTTTIINSRWQ